MSLLTINRIKNFLDKEFKDKIDLSNLHDKCSEEDRTNQFRTRALAAYALTVEAFADIDEAASSITDGYGDNGIDAIYYDEAKHNLWVVQSKFIQKFNGGIDTGDIDKFARGIKNLINADFSKFNDKIKSMQDEILSALDEPSVKIQILFAYTGKSLSKENLDPIELLLKEQNETEELFFFNDFNIDKAYQGLISGIDSAPINEDFLLSSWGYIEEPLQSYYGQIAGSDLAALWEKYNARLFTKNIRSFLGASSVNDDIQNTIINEPENFIYFNNGITVLCESIKKKPQGGSAKNIGSFACKGISIVNGAQTFGTIGNMAQNPDVDLSKVNVFVKFISLEGSSPEFGERITIATNTQNKVDRKDFVSLDKEQERIKIELKLENVDYHYKRSRDKVIPNEQNYTFEEVAYSLACFWTDVDYSTLVKKQSGKLWEDPQQTPYINLFNDRLSAVKILKTVKVYRYVSKVMDELSKKSFGRKRSINNYGNAFVTHIVMQKSGPKYWSDTYHKFDEFFDNILPDIVKNTIDELHSLIDSEYPDSMIVYVLRNFTKCRHLKNKMLGG
ncbi:abortive phage resistance protein [Vibrio cholerae]|uniref:AIPR family protein n=2 Tax=Vibrio cholerae TaxID=666 RepID=UPI0016526568|nr:AIPR family protein [Vibrio cholerae]EKF9139831.1 AIPR family protein [Vibrio cholerae]GIA39511.1 abortive phage resistance protein [Vibrio cholerae]